MITPHLLSAMHCLLFPTDPEFDFHLVTSFLADELNFFNCCGTSRLKRDVGAAAAKNIYIN